MRDMSSRAFYQIYVIASSLWIDGYRQTENGLRIAHRAGNGDLQAVTAICRWRRVVDQEVETAVDDLE
jgi:hypothetical protein